MSFALVGLATGLGARYPRFAADNATQVAGSYGGVAFMIDRRAVHPHHDRAARLAVVVYLFHQVRRRPLAGTQQLAIGACFPRRRGAEPRDLVARDASGVRALQEMDRTPT